VAKLSKKKIEILAVSAVVNEAIKPSSYLTPDIPVGDKGISLDGKIEVFIDDSEKTESLMGHVPVQLKGTQVKEFSQDKISFSLKLSHYRNYYKTNGALLLVVEVTETGDTKIFYKQLLPLELSTIIKEFGIFKKQKSRSVELRPLEETSLYGVCRKFLTERDLQPKALIENNPFSVTQYSQYMVSSLTFNPGKHDMNHIFDHDFTIYGGVNNLKVPLLQARVAEWKQSIQEVIQIDGKKNTYNIEVIRAEEEITFIFEEVFKFSFNDKTKKINMNFLEFHSLAAQLKVIPLVLHLFMNKELNELGININNWHATSVEISRIIDQIQQRYADYQDLKKVFEILGVDENKVFSATGTDPDLDSYKGFQYLTKAILHNNLDGIVLQNPAYPCLVNFRVGNFMCVLDYDPSSKKRLTNAFSDRKKSVLVTIKNEGEETTHSLYVMLSADSLAKAENINHSIIRSSFDKFDPFQSEFAFGITNDFCLKCITAYDLSKNIALLDTTEHIFNKYKPTGSPSSPTMNDAIITTNLCQIRKRKQGKLSTEDLEALLVLKSNYMKEDFVELIFCINVLLESKVEATMTFRKLKPERQKYYEDLPINYLYQELIKSGT